MPREIGQDILSSVLTQDGVLSVHKAHLSNTGYSSNVFWVNKVVSLKSRSRLRYESESGAVTSYEVASSMSNADQFEIAPFTATVFVFESPPYPSPRGKRGACFYTREKQDLHTISEIDLVFVCPVLVEETVAGIAQSSSLDLEKENTYSIKPISSSAPAS